jgi:hypothetical protein
MDGNNVIKIWRNNVCGGDMCNSVYRTFHGHLRHNLTSPVHSQPYIYLNDSISDVIFFQSISGASCTTTCNNQGYTCDEQLMPLILKNCLRIKSILGCDTCIDATNPYDGIISPGRDGNSSICIMSKAKYGRCDTSGKEHWTRACVCVKT